MMSEEAKEARRKYMREYQRTDEHKKKHAIQQKAWREKNKDKTNAYYREWAKRNPDKVRRYKETYWERRAAKELENENP